MKDVFEEHGERSEFHIRGHSLFCDHQLCPTAAAMYSSGKETLSLNADLYGVAYKIENFHRDNPINKRFIGP